MRAHSPIDHRPCFDSDPVWSQLFARGDDGTWSWKDTDNVYCDTEWGVSPEDPALEADEESQRLRDELDRDEQMVDLDAVQRTGTLTLGAAAKVRRDSHFTSSPGADCTLG